MLSPHLRTRGLPDDDALITIDNLEHALLCLEDELWEKLDSPSITDQGDGTFRTGDPLLDSLEQSLADGEDFADVISRLNTNPVFS